MLAHATGATPWGIDARDVRVEVDVRAGLPQIQIVGLADAAIRESKERVRSAIRNCGFDLPPRAVTVNLAPADLPKAGNHLDLPIALALLGAYEHLPLEALDGVLSCGELGLDGTLRPIRGALAISELATGRRSRLLIVPSVNGAEASALDGVPVAAAKGLAEVVEHLLGLSELPAARPESELETAEPSERAPDLADVRGQEAAKRALEIAAAGGHNVLFIGPPGCGKTMLARRLPALLPPLTHRESIEVTKIRSAAAPPRRGLVSQRPFRSPHASVSEAALVGGGSIPRPGEITLAHLGVLFLDELPEFRRNALESLRQPLEDGVITVVRSRASITYPARFALLASMNPCPCGFAGHPRKDCTCSPVQVARYRARVSGPLLDRIDLHVEVPALQLSEYKGVGGESSDEVARRVVRARQRQRERLASEGGPSVNAAMKTSGVRRHVQLEAQAQELLDHAFDRLALSARAATRILKVARTLADLADEDRVGSQHVGEAIQYRSLLERSATPK